MRRFRFTQITQHNKYFIEIKTLPNRNDSVEYYENFSNRTTVNVLFSNRYFKKIDISLYLRYIDQDKIKNKTKDSKRLDRTL